MMKKITAYLFSLLVLAALALPLNARISPSAGWRIFPQDTVKASAAAVDSVSEAPKKMDSTAVLAIIDSLEIDEMRRRLAPMGLWDVDSMTVFQIDSMTEYLFDSLARDLPDTVDIRRAQRRIAKEYRDSVRIATPRLLETFAIPDSLCYERLMTWTSEHYFNELKMDKLDTLYNAHFYDYPFYRKDVGATYLGTTGSAAQHYNYFKRDHLPEFEQFDPYLTWSYTPETLPQFNTKTPYTQLAYEGTTFSLKALEESQVQLLTTQNITPAFNFTLSFNQYGAKGMLQKEVTDNRTAFVSMNYLGKRYLMNAGYIGQGVKRTENGGIVDSKWIRDTIVDTKEIDVTLQNASNNLKRRTYFITQSYAIPMNFFRKDKDSLAVGEGTMAYIGHSGEFSTYGKVYTDKISSNLEKDFYDNNFMINRQGSSDSLALTRFENRFFIKLQPFSPDAIVSRLNGGIGYQMLSYYSFDPEYYFKGPKKNTYHNAYLYAGASGIFRKYFAWDADGKYTFLGRNFGDLSLGGKVRFSLYPIEEGIHLEGRIRTTLTEPSPYQQRVFMNHHSWTNEFKKVSESRIEALLDIPEWKMKAGFGYALTDGMIYYDSTSFIRQAEEPLSVMSAWAEKDLRLWFIHLDNKVLFQLSSDNNVLPLPKLAVHGRYYFQFTVVKDAMDMQLGLDATYTTAFYEQGYMPDLGVFYNQNKELIGNTPYFDAFVNMQWQCVCVYVKYTNCFLGWPQSDYFSAYHYIKPARAFKFGVFWPF